MVNAITQADYNYDEEGEASTALTLEERYEAAKTITDPTQRSEVLKALAVEAANDDTAKKTMATVQADALECVRRGLI